jgi:hypothetical protein
MMNAEDDLEMRRAKYRATSEALARVRIQEAAALTDDEAARIIRSLVAVGTPWQERPDWSGLVEQQAIFMRGRKT